MSELFAALERLGQAVRGVRSIGLPATAMTVAHRAYRRGRDRRRGRRLAGRVPAVTAWELERALGGRSAVEAFAGAVAVLPSVERFLAELPGMPGQQRDRLLAVADAICAHRFDLLGSGVTELGQRIDWCADFKTGRRWPPEHHSRIVTVYGDGSDIKVPWELSRGQHLPVLAAAWHLTADESYLAEIADQMADWIVVNPVEYGVNWACTMDVAIRAINWTATLAMCAREPAMQPVVALAGRVMLEHLRFIRGHMETEPIRGNHYLANVVGLLVVAGVFQGSPEGRRIARWAVRRLGREFRHQVRADGLAHEASLSYHRLVTELFVLGRDAARLPAGSCLAPDLCAGIERMIDAVGEYTRADGLAPQIGDVDDGRILPLGDYGSADQRNHLHVFVQSGRPPVIATRSRAFHDSGLYILRAGETFVAVRCGGVGMYGRGAHAHNDVLALEISFGETPVVIDPGSYVYTADPVERARFRSTAAHATLQVDDREQNELVPTRPFVLIDRARTAVLHWSPDAGEPVFAGCHYGFGDRSETIRHSRTVTLRESGAEVDVIDRVETGRPHIVTLRLTLAASHVSPSTAGAEIHCGGRSVAVDVDGASPGCVSGWISPSYGVRFPAPVLQWSQAVPPGVTVLRWRLRSLAHATAAG